MDFFTSDDVSYETSRLVTRNHSGPTSSHLAPTWTEGLTRVVWTRHEGPSTTKEKVSSGTWEKITKPNSQRSRPETRSGPSKEETELSG